MKETNFNKSALRAVLRKSDRLICQPIEGKILLCNGFAIWALTPEEYADIAQPVTKTEPGRWELTAAGRKDSDFDIYRIFTGYADKARTAGAVAAEAAASFPNGKTVLYAYYTEKTVATFNSDYVGTVADPAPMITDEISPVVFVSRESGPVALVLPVRIKPEIAAAVRALHGLENPAAESTGAESGAKLEAAENEIAALRAELEEERTASAPLSEALAEVAARSAAFRVDLEAAKAAQQAAEAEAAALRAELEAARAALTEAQQAAALQASAAAQQAAESAQPRPATVEAKHNNHIAAMTARFADLPGVVVTVKGAQTAAPVAWLSGAVEENAEAIRAAGARWSVRRNAYYYKIA